MSLGEKYITKDNAGLSSIQLLKSMTLKDANDKPVFAMGLGFVIPPPPFIIASTNNITGLTYIEGIGPSAPSALFEIIWANLSPGSGNITFDLSNANFEIYDGSVWHSSDFTVAYGSSSGNTSSIYKARLKVGLGDNSYSGTLTIKAANSDDFVINLSGIVTPEQHLSIVTGITPVRDGNYLVYEYNGDDDFEVIGMATNPANNDVAVLVDAGGGGTSASDNTSGNGGGGGGGVIETTYTIPSIGSNPVIVGAGGSAGVGSNGEIATRGNNSSVFGLTAIGGGIGKNSSSLAQDVALMNGGCGGGTGRTGGSAQNGGIGIVGQGNDGGDTPTIAGSGGGGGGGVGQDSNVNFGGAGGIGYLSSITGVATYYSGGGGGGGFNGNVGGAGGIGGGANGGTPAAHGTANTGGGGGGVGGFPVYGYGFNGGNGGSGKVIIRVYNPL